MLIPIEMSPEDVEECIKKFRIKKIKAVLTMYNGGYPSNIEKFQYLKKNINVLLLKMHATHLEQNISLKIKFKSWKL